MDLMKLTAVQLGKKIQSGEISVKDAVLAALEKIEQSDDTLNSFVTVLERDAILARAAQVQEKIDRGELTGVLAGVPVAIKDNMCTEGILTTCSSNILANFKPTYTAEAVRNLEQAGAVLIGKTNMDETRTIRSMCPAVHPAAPAPASLRMSVRMPWVPIRGGPSASRAHFAA